MLITDESAAAFSMQYESDDASTPLERCCDELEEHDVSAGRDGR